MRKFDELFFKKSLWFSFGPRPACDARRYVTVRVRIRAVLSVSLFSLFGRLGASTGPRALTPADSDSESSPAPAAQPGPPRRPLANDSDRLRTWQSLHIRRKSWAKSIELIQVCDDPPAGAGIAAASSSWPGDPGLGS